jgi:hypothetical protein
VSPVTNRVYLEGVLVSTQIYVFEYWLRVQPGQAPILEVLDEPDDVPNAAFPSYLMLGWMRDADCSRYKIEEYVSGVWTERAQVVPDSGAEFMTYATGVLADVTTANWRVTGQDSAGNWGTALQFVALMCRYPDPPSVSYTYNSGTGTVTIQAA